MAETVGPAASDGRRNSQLPIRFGRFRRSRSSLRVSLSRSPRLPPAVSPIAGYGRVGGEDPVSQNAPPIRGPAPIPHVPLHGDALHRTSSLRWPLATGELSADVRRLQLNAEPLRRRRTARLSGVDGLDDRSAGIELLVDAADPLRDAGVGADPSP